MVACHPCNVNFLLIVNPLLRRNTAIIRMFDIPHFSDQIGCLDDLGRSTSAGQDDMLCRWFMSEQIEDIFDIDETERHGGIDFIKYDYIPRPRQNPLAGESHGFSSRLLVLGQGFYIAQAVDESAPQANELESRSQSLGGLCLSRRVRTLDELDYGDGHVMAGSPQSDAQSCTCFPFSVSGKYDDQAFVQDALP
jgi:hypothetical protein